MPDAATLIDLASDRSIAIQDRGHTYVYHLSPIGRTDWKRYFDGIVSTSETIDKNIVNVYENTAASAELVRSVLFDVAGYKIAGGEQLSSLANWKTMLPLSHLTSVAQTLRGVERVSSEEPVTLGCETVTLSAIWGLSEDGKGMLRRTGLVHRFRTPTIDQQRRYSRDSSRSVIVGGSRTGKTKWLGVQNTLVEIYDELVDSIEGYRIGYNALEDPATIKANMDSYHKIAAAEGLFAMATVDEQEAEAK